MSRGEGGGGLCSAATLTCLADCSTDHPTLTPTPGPDCPPSPGRSPGDVCGNTTSCCSRGDLHSYHHASPQSFCLLAEAGGMQQLAVDWVGRVEAFEQDFGELLVQLNARPGVPQLPLLPPPERANVAPEACYEAGGWGGWGSSVAGDIRRFSATSLQRLQSSERSSLPSPWQEQLNVSYPCSKQEFFSGPYRQCLPKLAAFYADDLRLLHGIGTGAAPASTSPPAMNTL